MLQGITGVNEKWRIKATLAKNVYCANSANYILVGGSKAHVLLGILNSCLMNFFFSKFSTNSNVNGYEVDVLPVFPDVSLEQTTRMTGLVDRILSAKEENPSADTSALEREIDKLVYKLYDLTDDEIRVIEGTEGGGADGGAKPQPIETSKPQPARNANKKRKPKIIEEF